MAAEISVDSFLDLVRQSGLVSDNQMLSFMAEFTSDHPQPQTARAMADEFIKRGLLTEWQADNLLQGKHRGFFLGPHRILRQLGQGGMSKVFLAEHEMMRRRCAIKILPSKHQADPDLLSRFRLEAFAIAQLDHPHIVRAYDFNKDMKYGKEIDYLVMEYVEGQDLRRMVEEQGPLDYRKAADFICQAAEGLAHAHAVGLVHRDVKPANLLVDPNGVLKILDLGLARVTLEGEDAWQTSEGEQSAVGTADYVAPEQVMDSRGVDGRADIYSLGYTFYYLLTGRRPFPKSTLVELLMAHRVENPEPIAKLRPDVPLELIEIVDQMTAKTPDRRIQTAKEVAEKLQAWLRDSESGREYSRISALMAAAMRTKQPGPEESQPKSESSHNAVLELAMIDDDVTAAPRPKQPVNRRAEPLKATELREKPRKSSDSGKASVLNRTQADILLDLPDQGRLSPVVLPQFRRQSGVGNLLLSPWMWIGLAAAVAAILLILAIAFSLSSHNSQETDTPKPAMSEAPLPEPSSPVQTAAAPSSQSKPEEFSKEVASSAGGIAPTKTTEPPANPPPESKPTPTPTPETPAPAPREEPTPSPPPQTAPDKPPVEKAEKPIDPEALFAGMKTIAFRSSLPETDSNSWLNPIIGDRARKVAKQNRLTIDEKSPNVMSIDVKVSNESDMLTIVLSAELVCENPNGGTVTVWKKSQQIASIDSRRVRLDQAVKVVRTPVAQFFDQFTSDLRQARAKAKPE
jgi:serine/threonine protein kinase